MQTKPNQNTNDTISAINFKPLSFKTSTNKMGINRPQSMVEQIYHALSDAIVNGKLKPGTLIKELELKKIFGVSRAPIREAVRLLEAKGLLVVDAYKKKYVRRITRDYLNDILPFAACIEGFAARLALNNISADQLEMLEKLNSEMEQLYYLKDYVGCAHKNFDFHRTFIQASQNNSIRQATRAVTQGTIWFWITQTYYHKGSLIPLSISEHNEIIELFRLRDSDALESKVREHILNVFKRTIEVSAFDDNGDYIIP